MKRLLIVTVVALVWVRGLLVEELIAIAFNELIRASIRVVDQNLMRELRLIRFFESADQL